MSYDNYTKFKFFLGSIGGIALIFLGLSFPLQCEEEFVEQRQEMVKDQIEFRGINDSTVLAAMRKVKRHKFVPSQYRRFAYSDRPLPIGYDQTISQPYIVALMTSLLELEEDEKVLEIGTGSGYQAAILGEICDSVYTIEIIEQLGEQAKYRLQRLGYDNIKVKIGDGYKGWEKYSPYDGIIVTCAPSQVPAPLKRQLSENGRLVIPVGDRRQKLKLFIKKEGELIEKAIIPVRFVPMMKNSEEEY